jgi:hypothetical protein
MEGRKLSFATLQYVSTLIHSVEPIVLIITTHLSYSFIHFLVDERTTDYPPYGMLYPSVHHVAREDQQGRTFSRLTERFGTGGEAGSVRRR